MNILGALSNWAIAKHQMKIIAVMGRHGTQLTGEFLADALSSEVPIRRQLEKPFWDFSIPLAILGFEDRKYSAVEWLFIIARSCLRLLLKNSNPTWIILQVSTAKKEIAAFWLSIIKPYVAVVLNDMTEENYLEQALLQRSQFCTIVHSNFKGDERSKESKSNCSKECVVVTSAANEKSTLGINRWSKDDTGLKIDIQQKDAIGNQREEQVRVMQTGVFMIKPVLVTAALMLQLGCTWDHIQNRLLEVQLESDRFILHEPDK